MAFPGETVRGGASTFCSDCKTDVMDGGFKVMRSAAGYFIGTSCACLGGTIPWSRESGYYRTREGAEYALCHQEVTWREPDRRAPQRSVFRRV